MLIAHVLSVTESAAEKLLAALTPTVRLGISPVLFQSFAADKLPPGTEWARGIAAVVRVISYRWTA